MILALKSVIAAMLADKQSISSSIFLKSFFIFLIVSGEEMRGMNIWVVAHLTKKAAQSPKKIMITDIIYDIIYRYFSHLSQK